MIISISELRKHITTELSDSVLEAKLQALELKIRKYTNNRFHQIPMAKIKADVIDGVIVTISPIPFKVGDTVQITYGDKAIDCGLYTVKEITGESTFTVNEDISDMSSIQVIKVKYGMDVVLGVVDMMKWDLEKRDKVGIKSETISRHSVTYSDTTEFNSTLDYPKTLCGFLKPYMKPRF
jgi:hypothetical protein